jgi:hypothetical protein
MRSALLFVSICFVLAGNVAAQTAPSEPKRISGPHPIFPDGAENIIYGDSITVWMTVDKNGRVADAGTYGPLTPCSNIADPVAVGISQAAITAAKANVFEPILKNGKPIEFTIPITYQLRRRVSSGEPGSKTDKSDIVKGKMISLPQPQFSFDEKPRPPEKVSIRVLVGENGEVLSARPVAGRWLLFEATVKAACKARFGPTLLQGVPIKTTRVITYDFGDGSNPFRRMTVL